MNITEIQDFLDQKYPGNLGFFVFGSHNYGTVNSNSDTDLIVIDNSRNGLTVNDRYEIQFISKSSLIDGIENCDIKSLECYFSPNKNLKTDLNVAIKWDKLRSSISQKSSHSWVKGKKKIIDKELYIGKKSFFHSLRILDFGIQLATNQKIGNYESMKNVYFDIIKTEPNSVEKNFKKMYNSLHSEFKKVSPLVKD